MKLRTRTLAALSLPLLVAGCGMFSEKPAPAPMPDLTTASLLVLYHVHLGPSEEGWTDHTVYIDGVKTGRLNARQELRLQLAPGVHELSIRPETHWLGFEKKAPLKYSLQAFQGKTNYLRYRTTQGEGRVAPVTGTVFMDREISLVSEREYDARQ